MLLHVYDFLLSSIIHPASLLMTNIADMMCVINKQNIITINRAQQNNSLYIKQNIYVALVNTLGHVHHSSGGRWSSLIRAQTIKGGQQQVR